jgi:uncharacterized protein with GYD domain
MPKYLIAASYTGEGLQGLRKDRATGRRQAIATAIESIGGRLECEYFALGEHDVYLIADLPDTVSAAALGIATSATGLVHTRTTALMTAEEVDRALEKNVNYRAPGR